MDSTASFQLRTLGDLRLFAGDTELLAGRRKDLTLLAVLATHAPQRVPRARLAALLWSDSAEEHARLSLRQSLLKLRRTLEDAIDVDATSASVQSATVTFDARAFERDVAAGRFAEAVNAWSGDFLADADSLGGPEFRVWLEAERERLRRLFDWAMAGLVRTAQEQGAWTEAIRWAERWTTLRPAEVNAHVALVKSLRLGGRHADALAHYAACVPTLVELGAELGADWRALGDSLSREGPRVVADPMISSAALFTPDLVGRGAALAELKRLWQTVEAGAGAAVVVEGEEGVGVTRIVEALANSIGDGVVLRCRAYASEQDASYAAAGDLLDGLRDAPGLGGASGEALAALAIAAPWLRERFRGLPQPSADPGVVRQAALQVLSAVADEQPLLVWVDDVPEIDDASRRLALHLAARPPAGVLVVLGARVEAMERVPELTTLQRDERVRRIRLQPLSAADVHALVVSMLPIVPGDATELIGRIAVESGGNPLYAVQMVSALVDEGHLQATADGGWSLAEGAAGGALPIPTTVREAVRRRISRLGEPARALLEAAAVLGEPFESERVGAAAELSAADVRHAVGELLERRLIRESASGAPRYEIAQELTRRVAYDLSSVERRRALEARLRPVDKGRVQHRSPVAPRRRRMAIAAVLAAAVIVLAIGGLTAVLRPRGGSVDAGAATAHRLAVFPFAVNGGPELGYLEEGLVDLLTTALDGAGDLSIVDPRRADSGAVAPRAEVARAIAARLGAAVYVTGSVTEARGVVHLVASLHRTDGGNDTPVRLSAVGDPGALVALVDTLARGIMVAGTGVETTLGGLAAASTSSLPALKLFLQGEAAFRHGAYTAAVEAFHRATVIDTGFALAYYRESVAAEWVLPPAEPPRLAQLAYAHRDRLAPRTRQLLVALQASRAGDFVEATRQLRMALLDYPNDAESWFELGEVLNHHGPFFGSAAVAARPAFERALQLDPEDIHSIIHLARLAALDQRRASLDSLLRRGEQIGSQRDRPVELQLLRAFVWNDSALARSVAETIRRNQADVTNPVWNVAVYAENLPGAESLSHLFLDPARGAGWNGVGHRYAMHLRAAQGKRSGTAEALGRFATIDPAAALEYRALHALLWQDVNGSGQPSSAERAEVAAVSRALADWSGARVAHPDPDDFISVHDTIHPQLRAYLRGRIGIVQGDRALVEASDAQLAQLRSAPYTLPFALLHSLRAHAAASVHDAPRALAELDSTTLRVWHAWRFRSAFYAQPHDRWLRAELLHQLRRDDEALQWYASFDGSTMFDLPYLAPSHLRRAEILSQRGDCSAADAHMARAERLWRGADADLVARVGHRAVCR